MKTGSRLTQALILGGLAAGFGAVMIGVTGGFNVRLGRVLVRSHSALVPGLVALACLAAAGWTGRAGEALAGLTDAIDRRSAAIAAAAAIAGGVLGLAWGTYVAGGPDSYCYLNQAEMFARGDVREVQPLANRAPWPNHLDPFVPVGHVPAAGVSDAIVPMCAPGYPLMMAAARLAAGRGAMFLVVPLLGGLAIWVTSLLGRDVGGRTCGALSAVLLASSPTFLYQVVQPMTDVPAAALWTIALYLALCGKNEPASMRQSIATGAVTGLAVLVRPNLVPVAGVIALALLWRGGRGVAGSRDRRIAVRNAITFGLGAAPFIATVALLQNAMYGGPLKSGYGSLGRLFALSHVAPNLAQYSRWLIETETPFVLLALGAVWTARNLQRRTVLGLMAYVAAAVGCYLIYDVFDSWWYLRFVLLAFPAVFVLTALVTTSALSRLGPAYRGAALLMLAWMLVTVRIGIAYDRQVFRLWDLERRFRDGGEYVGRRLPANAIVLANMESGSVRFYSGRPTLLWGPLDPGGLDQAIAFLTAEGYHPYLLFETVEEPQFRKQFQGRSRLAGLEWPPVGRINREIQIFDPQDYDRYMTGSAVPTDWVWTKR
jgi:Dolichyl-phosphate-mannose-protein mannosyltransferase